MNHLPTHVQGGRGDRVDFNEENTRKTPAEHRQSKAGQSSALQFNSANSTLGQNVRSRQFKQRTAPVQAELIREIIQ